MGEKNSVSSNLTESSDSTNNSTSFENEGIKWDLPLKELYRLGLGFYKEKVGKALHLSYEDKLKLVAFTQQSKHGALDPKDMSPLGVLDVIGKDRRLAWLQLGSLSKAQAMEGFIDLLDRLCPLFKPYIEAIKKDKEEKQRLVCEAELKEQEQSKVKQIQLEAERLVQEEQMRREIQSRKIKDALNQQTYLQFRAYADQQYPGNTDQQAILIRQLQEQHYHQYMQQLQYNQQLNIKPAQEPQNQDENTPNRDLATNIENSNTSQEEQIELLESDSESQGDYSNISTASMWTREDMKSFKQAVSCGEGDGVIRVGHGETVTVRVPTHDGGTCLFWEFATDNYDIGFGVHFEWSKSPTNQVSVHISDSEEDDVELDEEEEDVALEEDLESADFESLNISSKPSPINKPPISVIVPVYRRDCQTEVYAGSHVYPGEGVYLLKFDNSYSLWRSKTLYYRVYYTR